MTSSRLGHKWADPNLGEANLMLVEGTGDKVQGFGAQRRTSMFTVGQRWGTRVRLRKPTFSLSQAGHYTRTFASSEPRPRNSTHSHCTTEFELKKLLELTSRRIPNSKQRTRNDSWLLAVACSCDSRVSFVFQKSISMIGRKLAEEPD